MAHDNAPDFTRIKRFAFFAKAWIFEQPGRRPHELLNDPRGCFGRDGFQMLVQADKVG